MTEDKNLQESLITIASELFRIKKVFEKVVSKLDISEQAKYNGQFSWFVKKVNQALEKADIRIQSVEGQLYDPGMVVTPLNIDEFEPDESLYIEQMIEPIIMCGSKVFKTGTVILGRVER